MAYTAKSDPEFVLLVLVTFLGSLCMNDFLSELIKVIVGERRPDYYSRYATANMERSVRVSSSKSFPSGHTASAFCCSVFTSLFVLTFFYARARSMWSRLLSLFFCALLTVISLAVGASRVTSNKHFLHDVIAGGVLGTLNAALFHCIMMAELRRRRNRKLFGAI